LIRTVGVTGDAVNALPCTVSATIAVGGCGGGGYDGCVMPAILGQRQGHPS
jgi:hypothetical protein